MLVLILMRAGLVMVRIFALMGLRAMMIVVDAMRVPNALDRGEDQPIHNRAGGGKYADSRKGRMFMLSGRPVRDQSVRSDEALAEIHA